MPDDEWRGMTAVVTGAASGIGLATTRALVARGARVAALDIRPIEDARALIALAAYRTHQDSIDSALPRAIDAMGGLDLLVNNAGIGAVGSVEEVPDDEWRHVYDTNVIGAVRLARAVLPILRKSKSPAIVNVSSIAATAGLRQRACYSASKGALLSLTLAMAADLLSDGIRVNCVCPGTVDTPWVGRLLSAAGDPAAERSALEGRQPMGRLGTAEEVAAAILFLAAPSSSFVTGVALPVDGGMAGLRIPPRPR